MFGEFRQPRQKSIGTFDSWIFHTSYMCDMRPPGPARAQIRRCRWSVPTDWSWGILSQVENNGALHNIFQLHSQLFQQLYTYSAD